MTDPESYVRNLKNIDTSIKRYADQLKELKEKRKLTQQRLYAYMKKNGLEKYQGYELKKLEPKQKTPTKKKADKKRDAIQLFHNVGFDDPEALWNAFQDTQKVIPDQNSDEMH